MMKSTNISMFSSPKTYVILISALLVAIISILPSTQYLAGISLIAGGLSVGETIFHETGHALFGWLTGHVSIPSIFTLFRPAGSTAAGVAFSFERSIILQVAMIAGLLYFCYQLKMKSSWFAIPLYVLTATIIVFSLTSKYSLLVEYGGHFSCMLFGSFLLFRGILNLQSRHQFERWLNALFGWFLLLSNAFFSYRIVSDPLFKYHYENGATIAAGVHTHNDYVKMAENVGLSLATVSVINIAVCLLLIALSFGVAFHQRHKL